MHAFQHARKRLMSLDCAQGGFVWLFYGGDNFPADERPPIPYVPELDDPTWKPVYGEVLLMQSSDEEGSFVRDCSNCTLLTTHLDLYCRTVVIHCHRADLVMLVYLAGTCRSWSLLHSAGEIEFDCNHWSVFENAIDMAHIHYLHSDSFGNQESPQIRGMQTTHNAYGVKASFGLHNKPVNKFWEFSQVCHFASICHLHAVLPCVAVMTISGAIPHHSLVHVHKRSRLKLLETLEGGLSVCLAADIVLRSTCLLTDLTAVLQVPIVNVTARALLPSTSVISFTLGNGLSFTTFVNTVPVNGNRTVNRFALVRNLAIDKTGIFNMGAWDRFARQAMIK